jgi:hypothetical protein
LPGEKSNSCVELTTRISLLLILSGSYESTAPHTPSLHAHRHLHVT